MEVAAPNSEPGSNRVLAPVFAEPDRRAEVGLGRGIGLPSAGKSVGAAIRTSEYARRSRSMRPGLS